jgi:cell division protein ZapE
VIVPTSNTASRDLYRNGLNRQLFTAFIALIEERMETHELESAKDYRLENLQGSVPQAALGVACCTFADLCGAPSADCQRIARIYHALMIEEIPVLGAERRNEAPSHHSDQRALRQWGRANRFGRSRAARPLH